MAAPRPIGVTGDMCDIPGTTGKLSGPPNVFASVTPRVLAEGRPVLTLGAILAPHGNFTRPTLPGGAPDPTYNPVCKMGHITSFVSTSVLIEGKPAAFAGAQIGSTCDCTHRDAGPGAPRVLIGR